MALNFPDNPTIGYVYVDSTSNFSYEWDGTVWKSYTGASSSNIKILDDISGSFNGITTSFTLTSSGNLVYPPTPQSLIINVGGVIQDPSDDYSVSDSSISFSTAPEPGLSFSGILLGSAIPIAYANDGNLYIRKNYTGAGTTGPFDIVEGYTPGNLDVYRNGVRLVYETDFVGTSGTNFFLSEVATVNDEIEAVAYQITSLVQSSSNLDNLNVIGITTTGRLNVSTNAVVSGITTFGLLNTVKIDSNGNINASGIVTATSFIGNGSQLTGIAISYTPSAGIATYANIAGVSTYASTAGVSTVSQGLTGTPNISVGIVTATNYFGNGSNLTGIGVSGSLLREPQVLTSGTSYTTPTGCTKIYVECIGGGGAGGGATSSGGSGGENGGGGGGAGAYCAKYFTVTPSTTYSYQIGTGGLGVSGNSGNSGGSTTFTVGAVTLQAGGGGGGTGASVSSTAGGSGGSASNGDINIFGNAGNPGFIGVRNGGNGGASFFGGSGKGVGYSAAQGGAGYNGGGGGGAASYTGGGNQAGGDGGNGLIRIWEYS